MTPPSRSTYALVLGSFSKRYNLHGLLNPLSLLSRTHISFIDNHHPPSLITVCSIARSAINTLTADTWPTKRPFAFSHTHICERWWIIVFRHRHHHHTSAKHQSSPQYLLNHNSKSAKQSAHLVWFQWIREQDVRLCDRATAKVLFRFCFQISVKIKGKSEIDSRWLNSATGYKTNTTHFKWLFDTLFESVYMVYGYLQIAGVWFWFLRNVS